MTILTSALGGKFVWRRKLLLVWSFQAPFKVSYSACGWPYQRGYSSSTTRIRTLCRILKFSLKDEFPLWRRASYVPS